MYFISLLVLLEYDLSNLNVGFFVEKKIGRQNQTTTSETSLNT